MAAHCSTLQSWPRAELPISMLGLPSPSMPKQPTTMPGSGVYANDFLHSQLPWNSPITPVSTHECSSIPVSSAAPVPGS